MNSIISDFISVVCVSSNLSDIWHQIDTMKTYYTLTIGDIVKRWSKFANKLFLIISIFLERLWPMTVRCLSSSEWRNCLFTSFSNHKIIQKFYYYYPPVKAFKYEQNINNIRFIFLIWKGSWSLPVSSQ